MTAANAYAGERLEHPAIARTVDLNGAVRFALSGTVDRDASGVLARLIRNDLLAAHAGRRRTDSDIGKRQAFVIDLAAGPTLDTRMLDSLRHDAELIQREMGSLEFVNVSDEHFALLKAARFTNCFNVRRAS